MAERFPIRPYNLIRNQIPDKRHAQIIFIIGLLKSFLVTVTVPKSFLVTVTTVPVASDCNPRWLTKHLLNVASRSVPLIFVRDNNEGSLRFGELVQLKSSIAIGIKQRWKL
ncbi:hypothetical protein E2542_SST25195 [Spatholobus suberectus]|nr:hypothetical protein E2542_SST25195 [Spatholobus suberectus]